MHAPPAPLRIGFRCEAYPILCDFYAQFSVNKEKIMRRYPQ